MRSLLSYLKAVDHLGVWIEMTKIESAVAQLNLAEAEAFLSVTVHRNVRGEAVPTMTVIVDGAAAEFADEFRTHMSALAGTLRKAYHGKIS